MADEKAKKDGVKKKETGGTEMAKREGASVTSLDQERQMRDRAVFRPTTDIGEADDRLVLEIELPGTPKDGVEVTLENRTLTIRATGKQRAREGWRLVHQEYSEGDYERAFVLSGEIDEDKIDAEMRQGLLRLTLPKVEAAKSRKIDIRAA